MKNTTKIVTVWELYQQKIPKSHIAKHLSIHRETVGIWTKEIDKIGLEAFLDNYLKAKKGERQKRQLDPILKRRIWEIREREEQCCGEKIQYFLKKEYGLKIATSTIYIALNEKYKLRSKWKKNGIRGELPKAEGPREVIQMDTVDFGEIFAFTGVDIFSREVDVLITSSITSSYGSQFLDFSMARRFNGFSKLIQTDGGSEFEAEFKLNVINYCETHRIARPYKKNEQAYIESFNRTLRKECLGWRKYRLNELAYAQNQVEIFLKRYHYHRPHMGLGMKPPLT
jgi:transposase